jgi:hypothetical protein
MTESRPPRRGRSSFDRFAEQVSDIVSGAPFFTVSAALVVLWLPTIVVFSSVDTWQLVINTATSILAFLLVALLPQRPGGGPEARQPRPPSRRAARHDPSRGGDLTGRSIRVRSLCEPR